MKRLFRKRWVRWTFGIIAALVGWFVATELYGEWKWNRYVEDARKRGVKLYIEEFLPKEPIPDAENFAAMPFWEAVLAKGDATVDKDFPKIAEPEQAMAVFTKTDLVEIRKSLIRDGWIIDSPGENPAQAVLAGIAERYGTTLAAIHAGLGRKRSRFPVHWENGPTASMLHLDVIVRVAKVLHLKVIAEFVQEERAKAFSDLNDMIGLVRVLDDEPGIIGLLVQALIERRIFSIVAEGIEAKWLTDDMLSALQARFLDRDYVRRFHFVVGSERAISNTWFDRTIPKRVSAGRDYINALMVEDGIDGSMLEWVVKWKALRRAWWRQNQLWTNERWADVQKGWDVEKRLCCFPSARSTDPSKLSPLEHFDLYVAVAGPDWLPGVERGVRFGEAMVRLGVIGCALERCKRARGGYPELLSELVPDFTAALPHDPVTGESFKYSRSDTEGYLLYSTGEDGKDDGGSMGEEFKDVEASSPDWRWFAPRGK